jgi:hypothetical protein
MAVTSRLLDFLLDGSDHVLAIIVVLFLLVMVLIAWLMVTHPQGGLTTKDELERDQQDTSV